MSPFGKGPAFGKGRRKAVRLSRGELVSTRFFDEAERLPLVVRPKAEGLDLASWAGDQRSTVEGWLLEHGAVLFRDFGLDSVEAFQAVARAVSPELLEYQERAAPRHEVAKNVFTSTEYPADQWIPLHHEMSYSHHWPTKLWFYCVQPALERGCTPLVDDRKVIDRIDPEIKRRFIDKKVMYVRNYGEGVDLPWQEVFQTTNRRAVEDYCRKAGMEFQWREGDRLRTRSVRQVLATHPKTGDTVWFNHAHMFHHSNLQPAVRDALLEEFAEDELPRNAFYGDGSAIDDRDLEAIREVYRQSMVLFPWQQGDLLLVDNFLASHGREPFIGPRKIVVAMAEPYVDPPMREV